MESVPRNKKKDQWPLAIDFRTTYAKTAPVHFVGLWDTITSMGLFNRTHYPFTINNHSVLHLRHAMAIDERRSFFRQNLFGNGNTNGTKKQVWFSGVHADVGGSYDLKESGLAQITLEWMMQEAERKGLLINIARRNNVLYDALGKSHSIPDNTAARHESLRGFWWMLEALPQLRVYPFRIAAPGRGQARDLFTDSLKNPVRPTIHISVVHKCISQTDYCPSNLSAEQLRYCIIEMENDNTAETPARINTPTKGSE